MEHVGKSQYKGRHTTKTGMGSQNPGRELGWSPLHEYHRHSKNFSILGFDCPCFA